MPSNPTNTLVEGGIENLLPERVITADMFDQVTKKKRGGTQVVTTTLNKMRLCNHICLQRHDASDFSNFESILDSIEAISNQEYQQATRPAD
jgi:hypothetical protein